MMRPFISITLFVLCCQHSVESAKRFNIDGNKYYISTPERYYFYQALEFCASNGMVLVDIRSEIEQKRINTVIQIVKKELNIINLYCWTSGTNTGQDGDQFFWLTTGETVVYKNWNNNTGSGSNLFIRVHSNPNGFWESAQQNVNSSLICRDKVDTALNDNGPRSVQVHQRNKATGIKLRNRSKQSQKYGKP